MIQEKYLKKGKKIAVLGAGVCGLHLALRFREAGFHVTIFSSSKEPCASLASHGLVSHKGYTLARDEFFSEKLEGSLRLRERIRLLEQEFSEDEIPLNEGVFELFADEKEAVSLRQRVYHRSFTGSFQSELLGVEEIKEKAPFLVKSLEREPHSAYFYPFGFSFDPLRYLELLRLHLEKKGVCFKDESLVSFREEGEALVLLKDGKKEAFDHILCALGAFTHEFLKNSKMALEPLLVSEGFTLRYHFTGDSKPFSALLSQKNYSLLGSKLTVGSYLPECLENSQNFFLSRFSSSFRGFLGSSPSFFTGKRVYQPSRKPLLRAFELSSGSKFIVLTGMHKSGFSLAEIYAEKAFSLI